MASTNSDSRDALHAWRFTASQAWRRIKVGWPDEQQAIAVRVKRDLHGNLFVGIDGQRRVKRGPQAGTWTGRDARGDIHTREDYICVLHAVMEAGFRAGFLTLDDTAVLLQTLRDRATNEQES